MRKLDLLSVSNAFVPLGNVIEYAYDLTGAVRVAIRERKANKIDDNAYINKLLKALELFMNQTDEDFKEIFDDELIDNEQEEDYE